MRGGVRLLARSVVDAIPINGIVFTRLDGSVRYDKIPFWYKGH